MIRQARTVALVLVLAGCHHSGPRTSGTVPGAAPAPAPAPAPQPQPQPQPTFDGVAAYENGAPASGALIAFTRISSAEQVAVVVADHDGHFQARLEPGEYALAVTANGGFAYVETAKAPVRGAKVSVSRACRNLSGGVKAAVPGTRVSAARKSSLSGDIFLADVSGDGRFALCLPEANYRIGLSGSMLSFPRGVDLTAADATNVDIEGFAETAVKQPPPAVDPFPAEMDGVVADLIAHDARLIGLGESTHGNAEHVTVRAALTFELVRRAGARLVMFEVDAVLTSALDDYVMGRNVDIEKAVAALGFWITDTREFLQFLADLRVYNATTKDKVHLAGVDAQNTEPPVALLLSRARPLKLTSDQQQMLKQLGEKRGAPVRAFTKQRRSALDSLLARFVNNKDLRIAIAARSLVVQVGYLDGDRVGLYSARRDAGMAELASYLVAHSGVPRVCVWAHAAHLAREASDAAPSMGEHLASVAANRYYPIGFYIHEGSVRSWDAAGEIGVISHRIPLAPDYSVEGAVMAATRNPDIAWVTMNTLPEALRTWFATPRYVREAGAVFGSEADLLTLRSASAAFDAIVVIKTGHDSTPTLTGVRKAD